MRNIYIILVDDEESILNLEKNVLENNGYTVFSFTNSVEALETFRSNPDKFDLVITDYMMPGLTGEQLVKELFCLRPDISIIMCTGYSKKLDEKKAGALGIKGYLVKPFSLLKFLETVKSVLNVY